MIDGTRSRDTERRQRRHQRRSGCAANRDQANRARHGERRSQAGADLKGRGHDVGADEDNEEVG